MSEVLQANIFFFIASVATVVFCVFICFILYQMYRILKLARAILERIESASEVMAQDVAEVRKLVAGGGFFTRILNFILGGQAERPKSRRKARPSDINK
ncbi:MAG: hypothetical protein AAB388_02370 [Patescibacteria group bacterium]